MSRTGDWRELKVGLIAAASIVGFVVFVLLFARVGALHGDTKNIYVVTDDAPGVLNGTEVWLAGQKIGLVKDVHFRPVTTDTMQRLAIHTQILADQMPYLRRDAYADIRPGGNLIGAPVVWISAGTSNSRALRDGDTVVTKSTGAMKPVGDKFEAFGDKIAALSDSGGKVMTMLNTQFGTLGRLGQNGLPRVAAAMRQISSLTRNATQGNGAVALVLRGDLRARVGRITATKDSITRLMNSGNGNVAQWKNDSTLMKTVSHLRGELDTLMTLNAASGTVTKARTDTALKAEMARMRVELAALMADLKKHPRSYISF